MSKIIAVSGVKNSGKTTLIEKILPILTDAGLKVAVIKHDGHGFSPDTQGTDTYRALTAGACGTAIFDGEKLQLVKRASVDEHALLAQFPEADLILLEGFKYSTWPKLEVVRAGNSEYPVCDPSTLLALVTDIHAPKNQNLHVPDVPMLDLNDATGVANFILQFMENQQFLKGATAHD